LGLFVTVNMPIAKQLMVSLI